MVYRRLWRSGLALASAVALSACGGDDAGGSGTVPVVVAPVINATPTATPTPAATPTPEATPDAGTSRGTSTIKIVTEGDSITEGLTGTTPGGWPARAVPSKLAAGYAYTLANVATSGISVLGSNGIANGYGGARTNVSGSFDRGKALNVLTVMGGTNDGAVTKRFELYRGLRAFIRMARATGYQRIGIGTLIARSSGPGADERFDATTLPLNGDIRANWNSDLDADGLIDFGADPVFDTAADALNPTYYTQAAPPALHPNDAGYEVMAGIAAPVIDRMVARAGTRVVAPRTWSPYDTNPFLLLSAGDRTLSYPNGFGDGAARGFPRMTTGKFAWETLIDTAQYTAVGLCNEKFEVAIQQNAGKLGASPNAIGWGYDEGQNNALRYNGVVQAIMGTLSDGDVIQHHLDRDAKRYWIRKVGGLWNNDPAANPATGVGGIDISGLGTGPLYAVGYIRTAPGRITARFAASQMTGPIAAGFTAFN